MMLASNSSKLKSVYYTIIILILCMICGFGMFLFIESLGLSKTISLAVSIVFFIGTLSLLFFINLLNNKPNSKKKVIWILTVICLAVVIINVGLIAMSPYFIPHNTSTANNKYYIKPFKYSYLIDNYTQDKTVYVAKDSLFLSEDNEEITPFDESNKLALFSSAKSVESLDHLKDATYEQIQYILSLEDQFEVANQQYALTKNAVFYVGENLGSFDEIVVLQDTNYDTYFMPYAFYKTIENMR